MKNINALGLMSGTSADGLSISYCRINLKKQELTVKHYESYAYDKALRDKIINARSQTLEDISELNFTLGRLWADMTEKFVKKFSIPIKEINIVGSHGQTVYHCSKKHTLQIGEAAFICEKLKKPVVCDFRPQDIAAGGEGAPLVPFFDEFVFSKEKHIALQNIGGVANVSVTGKNIKTFGFDNGVGNSLMDWAMVFYTGGKKSYDKNGDWASKGKADIKKAQDLAKNSFFLKKPPKSIDRELFGAKYLKNNFRLNALDKFDVLATLNYFTALTIAQSYKRFFKNMPPKTVISGGGALNKTLMLNLKKLLPDLKVESISQYGIHPLSKEPAAFALLAAARLEKVHNDPFQSTSASGPRLLGKLMDWGG